MIPLPGSSDLANMAGGLLFSAIGFVALAYGRRNQSPRHMVLGGLLMVYCYFTSTAMTYLIGAALTAALVFGG